MYFHNEYLRPRYEETDKMGVVYHGNYIVYFEQARSGIFRSLGYSYKKLEDEGVWFPVIEVGCKYFSPAIYDEEIYVKTCISEYKGVRITLSYEIYSKEKDTLLVTGFSKHAITNHKMKPISLKKKNLIVHEIINKCLED